MTKLTSELDRAASKIGASKLASGDWIYRDDGMRAHYVVTEADLLSLATDYMGHADKAIARDAYSHWCAGTTATQATAEQIAEVE